MRYKVRLAKEAEVDAQYAVAKAQADRQKAATAEVQKSLDALKNEAAKPAAPASVP